MNRSGKTRNSFPPITSRPVTTALPSTSEPAIGFQSIPLALLGFSVIAVDFFQPPLDELHMYAGALPIVTIRSNIRHYSSWAGRHPPLIVCISVTRTHLPALADVQDLIRSVFRTWTRAAGWSSP
jgi:hypothetical protein